MLVNMWLTHFTLSNDLNQLSPYNSNTFLSKKVTRKKEKVNYGVLFQL